MRRTTVPEPRHFAASLLVGFLVASGCGDSSEDSSDEIPADESSASTTTSTTGLSVEDRASFEAWEGCLDDGLAHEVGADRLAEIGYAGWMDFGSPSVEEWLLDEFPPGDEVMAFIDVMFECSEPRQWDSVIMGDAGLEDSDESRCFADVVVADPEVRLLYLFGSTPGADTGEPPPIVAEWAARALRNVSRGMRQLVMRIG